MASNYYKLESTNDPNTNWTTEVVLEVNDQGEPTKVVRAGVPVQLNEGDRKKLEELGFVLAQSSKSEADEVEASTSGVGEDVTGAAPLLGADTGRANQADESPKRDSSEKSNEK